MFLGYEKLLYFGESQSRVVLSVKAEHKEVIIRTAQNHGVPIYQIGNVGGERLLFGDKINLAVDEMKKIFQTAIPRRMAQ